MEHEGPCGLDQRDGFSLIRVGSHFYPEIQHQTPGNPIFFTAHLFLLTSSLKRLLLLPHLPHDLTHDLLCMKGHFVI